jgi:hypothetical protein
MLMLDSQVVHSDNHRSVYVLFISSKLELVADIMVVDVRPTISRDHRIFVVKLVQNFLCPAETARCIGHCLFVLLERREDCTDVEHGARYIHRVLFVLDL